MPRIAHRRRGSKFGRRPAKYFLVTSLLLPLARTASNLCRLFVLNSSPLCILKPGPVLCL